MPESRGAASVTLDTIIIPDDARVYRASEVVEMLNKPGASLRSVAADLGWTHTKLWRHLRANGYSPVEKWGRRGYGIPGDSDRRVKS